jgi:hypothetical protein
MNKIIFISDYFLDEILGGAEKNNDVFIKLISKYYNIEIIKSTLVTNKYIQDNINNYFIVANFFELSEQAKLFLQKECRYSIYEHDHKYVSTNNPAMFENYFVPDKFLINLNFYHKAEAVFCQSKLHSQIIYKNLLLQNIVNLGGNLWSENDLNILENNINTVKTIEYGIMESKNKNKGFYNSISYCKENNIKFDIIKFNDYKTFINDLSKVNNLIFFPEWVETYSRVAIEARILNCKIHTNELIGASSEDYFKFKGHKLLDYIKNNNFIIIQKIINVIEKKNIEIFKPFIIPKLTFITSLYKGEKYIINFINNITNLNLFNCSELLIYDSDSPENEHQLIKPYLDMHDNIIYKRLERNYTPAEVVNMCIKQSNGDLLTTAPVDDVRDDNFIVYTLRNIINNNDVVLVYGDCLQTNKENETIQINSSNNKLYEHSLEEFTKENMIKSLPGCMPVWKKEVHNTVGYFRTDLRYPIDWEMWLRMVKAGFKFKKINQIVGLYYFNENGLTTSKTNAINKHQEEAKIFFEYKDLFGNNFIKYKEYFSQFLKVQNE